MNLAEIVSDIADALVDIDGTGRSYRAFQPGVGPYGEPQLVKLIAQHLNRVPAYLGGARTKRCPDLLIPGEWAIEFKIARPYGDNGKEAENWSVNLLHPYSGNVSTIGDCYKLMNYQGKERRAVVVVGYEHTPPQIDLTPLVDAFEAIARNTSQVAIGPKIEIRRDGLIHPVHQSVRIFAWEVLLPKIA